MLKGLIMALIMLAFVGIGKLIHGKKKTDNEDPDDLWVCPRCTHINPCAKGICEKCGEERKKSS